MQFMNSKKREALRQMRQEANGDMSIVDDALVAAQRKAGSKPPTIAQVIEQINKIKSEGRRSSPTLAHT